MPPNDTLPPHDPVAVPSDSTQPVPVPGTTASPVDNPNLVLPPPAVPGSPRRKRLLLPVAIVVLIVLAAGGAWWWYAQAHTPSKVFTAALSKLLQTKTVMQTTSDSDTTGAVAFDLTDVKDPKVSMNIAIKADNLTLKVSGYGTLDNNYIKYVSFGNDQADAVYKSIVNKWIQIRADGKLAEGANLNVAPLSDPRYLAFGDIFVGNFSTKDREDILNYIIANKVYAYDANHVTTDKVHGKKVYVYSVTENVPKLKELNKKVAAMMGLQPSDIQTALNGLDTTGTVKLYIDISSKQIVRYAIDEGSSHITGSYTGYNTTSLPQQPKADLTWQQAEQQQADAQSNTLSGGGGQ